MKLKNPKTLKFYKSQKLLSKEILGDLLLIPSVTSHKSNLSKFVEHYLQPHEQTYNRTLETFQVLLEEIVIQEDVRDKILVSTDEKYL